MKTEFKSKAEGSGGSPATETKECKKSSGGVVMDGDGDCCERGDGKLKQGAEMDVVQLGFKVREGCPWTIVLVWPDDGSCELGEFEVA